MRSRTKSGLARHRAKPTALEPKCAADQKGLGEARLAAEDRSFGVAVDHESGRTIIKGMSETHLEIIVERLKREFKVAANIGAPRIADRETISRPADADHTRKKFTQTSGLFARIKIRLEPLPRGSGCSFENGVIGETVPAELPTPSRGGLKAMALEKNSSKSVALIPLHRTPQKPGGSP